MVNVFLIVHDFSGVKTYIDELSEFLSKKRDVFVFKIYLEFPDFKEFRIQQRGKIKSIYIPDKVSKEYNKKYYKRAAQLVYFHFNELKNVVFHANMPEQYFFIQEIKKFYQCPVVFTFHFLMSFYSFCDKVSGYDSDSNHNGNALEKFMLEDSDHIICVTKFSKRAITQLRKIDPTKTSVIYNGKSWSIISTGVNANLKIKYGFLPTDRIILYVGKLEQRKGIDILIGAFMLIKEKFTTTKLVIVGDGEYNNYLPLANDCIGRIHFTGNLGKNKVNDFYSLAEMGVIPSQYEQCSYVAIEMMQYKLPMIISDVPGLNELVIHMKSGLVSNSRLHKTIPFTIEADEVDLASKIEFFLEHPFEAKRFAQEAYNCGIKFHAIDRMGNETLKIYRHLNLKSKKNFILD